ncbi:hypothetical protein BK664_06050 [Pseudomonas brassicacearum]|uniref:Uncharacterized protein n=1 Tax=Pseudomonas brassicacearum TaxID=930166 RepID=A0A423JTS8_9PSED|nr:hypothetical protein BK664_06050 [Pseudomonas brassicacearum]
MHDDQLARRRVGQGGVIGFVKGGPRVGSSSGLLPDQARGSGVRHTVSDGQRLGLIALCQQAQLRELLLQLVTLVFQLA